MTIRASAYAHVNGLNSSPEVLAAIEEIAQCEFDADDCTDDNDAYRIWSDPTEDEMARVMVAAWKYADTDEDQLSWGCTTIRREIA